LDEEVAMTDPTLDVLTQRLDRLERELRRWKVLGGATVVVLGFVLGLGPTSAKPPDEVRAKRFILVGQDGKDRAILGSSLDGWPFLSLFGEEGLAKLDLEGGWPRLGMLGKKGESIGLSAGPDFAHVRLSGTGEVVIGAGGPLAPSTIHPPDLAGFLDLGGPVLSSRILLTTRLKGSPALSLYDVGGKERATLGRTNLVITAAGAKEERPASSLVLFDEDGKVIWRAP